MLKLADNPPSLYPDVSGPMALGGPWWVGHTKARCEKAFGWDLRERGIAYFLPLVERVTFSGGRKRRGMMPLFPGYVFFCGDEAARQGALRTDRLCQVIAVADQDQLGAELEQLYRVLREGRVTDPYPGMAVGVRCRVTAGPLKGIAGTLIRRDGALKFVLQISILGQGAELMIEPELVEALEES